MRNLSEIERLDLVARSEAAKALLARYRIPFTLFSALMILLAVVSSASFYETLCVRLAAVLAIATTVMLSRKSRFTGYFLSTLFVICVLGAWLFDDPDYHTPLGSATRYLISAMLLFAAHRWWTNGRVLAQGQSEAFSKERSRVEQWMITLASPNEPKASDNVVELSAKSFLRGDWTYRLLKIGEFWVVAKFKFGKLSRVRDCRVYPTDGVSVRDKPDGGHVIRLGDYSISTLDLTPETRYRFSNLLSGGTAA